jgi:Tfp pilus assembly protein PilN
MSIGWRFWSLREFSQQLDEDLAGAGAERHRLQSALAEVQQLETRRVDLQQRVSVIEQLHGQRSTVGQVLDAVANAVPDGLWLSELVHKDNELKLVGLATTFTGVSTLAGGLATSGVFRASVEILDIERTAHPAVGELVKFSVRATVNN